MSFFSKMSKNRIVISVGDNGAVVLNIVNSEVRDKYFIENKQDVDLSKVVSCIIEYKTSSIYLVLNHSEQIYTEHVMPTYNRVVAKSLVKMNLNDVMGDYDISDAFLLTKPNDSNKSCHYMVVKSQLNNLTKKLLEVIVSNLGNFCGILLLPTELSYLCDRLLKFYGKDNEGWVILIAYTKTNDFRKIVLYQGKIIHVSNVIITSDETLPSIIAGKIYQEISNTVLYLAKFGYSKESIINLYIITSSNIKTSLLSFDFKNMDSSILTPYELSKILALKQSSSVVSEFCDTVVLCAITEKTPLKVFHTKDTSLFYKILFFNKYVLPCLLCFIALLSLLNITYMFSINDNYDEKIDLLLRKEELVSKVEKISQDTTLKQVNEMYETVDVYKLLLADDFFSLDLILRLRKVDLKGFNVNYLSCNARGHGIAVKLLLKFVEEKQFSYYFNGLKDRIMEEFKDYKTEVIDTLPNVADNEKIIVVKLAK
ncbi:hypothetical protein [Ehrlichia canis]|uniref:Conserved domain protein n=1 Tax=Ehrlichia canis (strain Jake) TaxID=269484 RepID=A0ACA6AV79_EHRCJ|nr:hypothetical protein [Ehrlichia canis]AAZ68191.1 conserved domain protein [Ehrlichia canis str. Jake]AUO55042.1 hypothetical protein C1I72_04225 [Ehrlichia canis]UKC53114.1 hypothetical protein s20019040002_000157 [Ehrlichia canis]UKC54051.1 hypothetical protein s20026770001_000157 [Ehrlichia canis]UKC54987.1 hypothetical protein s21009500007_000157 [Ehrlichia canis]